MQRLGDQLLVDVRPVGVGGVEEIAAELVRAAQHAKGVRAVARRSPDVRSADAHGAEAEALDLELTDPDFHEPAPPAYPRARA